MPIKRGNISQKILFILTKGPPEKPDNSIGQKSIHYPRNRIEETGTWNNWDMQANVEKNKYFQLILKYKSESMQEE